MKYVQCSEEDLDQGTECLHLVLKYCGVKAKLILGPEDLWKVTHRKDLHLATAALKRKLACILSTRKECSKLHKFIISYNLYF